METVDKRRVNVRGIIIKNNKLFAVRLKQPDGSAGNYWCLPGGGLDPYETLEQGIVREMIEETGVRPVVGNLLYIQQLRSTRRHRDEELEFFFHITNTEDYAKVDFLNTTHGAKELSHAEFIDPKAVECILPSFLAKEDLVKVVADSQPIAIMNRLDENQIHEH